MFIIDALSFLVSSLTVIQEDLADELIFELVSK